MTQIKMGGGFFFWISLGYIFKSITDYKRNIVKKKIFHLNEEKKMT